MPDFILTPLVRRAKSASSLVDEFRFGENRIKQRAN